MQESERCEVLRFVLRPNVPTAPAERAERRDSSDPRFPLAPVQTQNVFWGQQAWQQEGKLRQGNTGSVVLRSIPNGKVIS